MGSLLALMVSGVLQLSHAMLGIDCQLNVESD